VDGRFVAFASFASNLHPDDPDAISDVFVRDLVTNTTTLVSRAAGAAGAKGNDGSFDPALSADGRYVAFYSFTTNLDPDDTDTTADVFVRNLVANTARQARPRTAASRSPSPTDPGASSPPHGVQTAAAQPGGRRSRALTPVPRRFDNGLGRTMPQSATRGWGARGGRRAPASPRPELAAQ
jgi:WD40-like Beta Propeller Repeat